MLVVGEVEDSIFKKRKDDEVNILQQLKLFLFFVGCDVFFIRLRVL